MKNQTIQAVTVVEHESYGSPPLETKQIAHLMNEELNDRHRKVVESLDAFSTKRELIDFQLKELSECIGIATSLFKEHPSTEKAQTISSLQNSYKGLIAHFDKMVDPKAQLVEIEGLIKGLVLEIAACINSEFQKSMQELQRTHPEAAPSFEDAIGKIAHVLSFKTNEIIKDLVDHLKMKLGIKK